MQWTRSIPAAALVVALGACGRRARNAGAPPATEAAPPAGSTAAVAPAAAPGSTAAATNTPSSTTTPAGPVPSSMDRAESLAEDIQDDIHAGSWAAAGDKVSQLQSLRRTLAATGAAPSRVTEYGGALDSLAAAVRARRRFPGLEAANHISRTLNAMMARYSMKVPIDVAYMDVAGRDGLYDARQGHWAAADSAVAEMRRSYAAVRSHVRTADAPLDGRITGELAAMQQATGAKRSVQFATQAKKFLDDVDNVEKTY